MKDNINRGTRADGYTIISYTGAGSMGGSPLIDMEGKIVHQWPIGGQPVKMLPDGSLIGHKRNRLGKNPLQADAASQPAELAKPGEPPRSGPWQDAIELVQVSWDGKEEWSFNAWDDDRSGVMMSRQHHDFQREGNPVGFYAPGCEFVKKGKTLILAHKNTLVPAISKKELEDDAIYEVDWSGKLTGFEWHPVDHFNEYGFDDAAKKAIYEGARYEEDKGFCDWLHINSLSWLGKNQWYQKLKDERFNPENMIISSRTSDFIAIISRATGKIVWKVGPDFSAGKPEHGLGQFRGQHHAHMIPQGLPGEGNILVFDNGGRTGLGRPSKEITDFSRVIEFNPVTMALVWQYGAEKGPEKYFSHNISAAQRLPNGNTLITDGANGHLLEVTTGKEIVWEFRGKAIGDRPIPIYRSYRVPPEWVPGNPSGYAFWSDKYK